jgi:hypothetical protein
MKPDDFKKWLLQGHLKKCEKCRIEGKAILTDLDYVAYGLWKAFYDFKTETSR